jgi:hypothetical protein
MADLLDRFFTRRIRCPDCDWCGSYRDALSAPHPFIEGETLYGCPGCKDIRPFRALCEAAGCDRDVSGGRNVPGEGYKFLCSTHWSEAEARHG